MVFFFLEKLKNFKFPAHPLQSPSYFSPSFDGRGISQSSKLKYIYFRFNYPKFPRIFFVSLKVGQREFIGEGSTRQAARHNAADKALKVLRTLPLPEKVEETTVESASATGTVGNGKLATECDIREATPFYFNILWGILFYSILYSILFYFLFNFLFYSIFCSIFYSLF